MPIDLDELFAMPPEERAKLGERLLESAVPSDIGPLLKELVSSLERSVRALDLAIARLSALDERLVQGRAKVREEVLSSSEAWPFPLSR
jgi:hypothetical protein